jgi:hypothetical protein
MEKELAKRIIKETINYAIDCYDREYVKYSLEENILSLDDSLESIYTEKHFDLEKCIEDALNCLIKN